MGETSTRSRLERHLCEIRVGGEVGLIPFVTAGDPDMATTRDVIIALDACGVSAIEVGVPFSDPIADGPVIQASSQRALDGGATLGAVFDMLEELAPIVRTPIVLFTYLNPPCRMGYEAFARRARAVGVEAVLTTDAVPGTEPALDEALDAAGLARIVLFAPTTPPARVRALALKARGFAYIIARRGVTGLGAAEEEAPEIVKIIREVSGIPTYVGFGVRASVDVARVGAYADGAIVGSALVELLHQTSDWRQRPARAAAFVRALRSP